MEVNNKKYIEKLVKIDGVKITDILSSIDIVMYLLKKNYIYGMENLMEEYFGRTVSEIRVECYVSPSGFENYFLGFNRIEGFYSIGEQG